MQTVLLLFIFVSLKSILSEYKDQVTSHLPSELLLDSGRDETSSPPSHHRGLRATTGGSEPQVKRVHSIRVGRKDAEPSNLKANNICINVYI